ncbi:ATP synthase gamma chain [bacterium BMS3Bbin12]|nr:ATP synthase gamma chain [bacterium BMS3Abin12]GBE47078.1 ATP synthase gamma chain [bacterium BMS3Bbin12]GBE51039.1 ATP synthase gamma chain [bacterium BMS3Bbin13]HDK02953.1 F0F1 ATP synthase subunit gamma [Gammaproteobacteria bacterium]
MAAGKEIRTKIGSIRNTQKITKAMEMVAASKMRRAQEHMAAARPYAERIRVVASHIALAHPEYRHPFLVERETRNIGIIVVATDRGLCGGLNINLFRCALQAASEWQEKGVGLKFALVGSKAGAFFRHVGGEVLAQADRLGDRPVMEQLIGVVGAMLSAYDKGEIDRLLIAENRFVNTMSQHPRVASLLPIPPAENTSMHHQWDYIYEPEAREVLDEVLRRYIESQVLQAVVENVACEMAARMVAMKSASDNAGELIEELQLVYNKARQAAITQEIAEIVSGAAAV